MLAVFAVLAVLAVLSALARIEGALTGPCRPTNGSPVPASKTRPETPPSDSIRAGDGLWISSISASGALTVACLPPAAHLADQNFSIRNVTRVNRPSSGVRPSGHLAAG